MRVSTSAPSLALALTLAAGCGGDGASQGNENEVITTVTLTFTPAGGGPPILARFDDPDGDGGSPPRIDPVDLPAGMFHLAVAFENRLETPPANITEEIEDEADEHQLFFTGTAVNGPASNQPSAPLVQTYADLDANGLPVGLASEVTAGAGTGTLTVTLRHVPPLNGTAVKTAGLAAAVRDRGFSGIGGSTDAEVSFPVTVR